MWRYWDAGGWPAGSERVSRQPAVLGDSGGEGRPLTSFVISALLLVALVAGGIALIVAIRETIRGSGAGRGDCDGTWEEDLAQYKNLRDRGVLNEDEYRRIKTLVDPSVRSATPTANEPSPAPAEGEISEDRRN